MTLTNKQKLNNALNRIKQKDAKKKQEFWRRIQLYRKQIEGKNHYIDDERAVCDACYITVINPHCYDVNMNSTLHFCIACHNLIKPKKKYVKIIYTPMK